MNYLGLDARTGLRIDGRAHLAQSVNKILGTAVGTRLRRRSFGALTADLIDTPANGAAVLQLYAASATALLAWEPRLRVRTLSVQADAKRPGCMLLTITGEADQAATSVPVTVTAALTGQAPKP